MVRAINAELLAKISEPMFYPIVFVWIDWPDDPVRVHSNVGPIDWNGNRYTGIGDLGSINVPVEGQGLVPEELQLTLTAELSEVMARAASITQRNRSVKAWLGCTTEPGGRVQVGEPLEVFFGTVDNTPFQQDQDGVEAAISVIAKSGPSARSNAAIVHTNEDQQKRYSTDTGFQRVSHANKWQTNLPQWPAL